MLATCLLYQAIAYFCFMENFNSSSQSSQAEGEKWAVSLSAPHESKKKVFTILVDNSPLHFDEQFVTGRTILQKADVLPVDCFELFRKGKGKDETLQLIAADASVDLDDSGVEKYITRPTETYTFRVNDQVVSTRESSLTPTAILQLAGLDPSVDYLVELKSDGTEILYAWSTDPIRINCPGPRFASRKWVTQIDIEEYGKTCQKVTPAKVYLVKVDKNKYPWTLPTITGKELIGLEITGDVSKYNLLKFYSNSPKPAPIKADEKVDLTEACLLRFVTQPKTQKDGGRKDFSLPSEDAQFLETAGFEWEALRERNYLWLVIHNFPVPPGYNTEEAKVALMIPPAYPAAQIDMAYFFPHLQKKSGLGIPAITSQMIDGKNFQRWSRHRQLGEWRPGVDCVSTHLVLVANWLEQDLNR
jgi:hypothetical protein